MFKNAMYNRVHHDQTNNLMLKDDVTEVDSCMGDKISHNNHLYKKACRLIMWLDR